MEAEAFAKWEAIKCEFQQNQRLNLDLRDLLQALRRLRAVRSSEARNVVPLRISAWAERPLHRQSPAMRAIYNSRLLPQRMESGDLNIADPWRDPSDETLSEIKRLIKEVTAVETSDADDEI